MCAARQLATCSADTTIKIWTPVLPSPSPSPHLPPSSSTGSPSPLDPSFSASDPNSPAAAAAAGYARGGIADGTGYQLDKVLQGHQRWVWDMAYSADSAYLVSGAF